VKPPVHLFAVVWVAALVATLFAFVTRPARGHDIYTQLTSGTMCARCGGNECEPVTAEPTTGGYWLPGSGELIALERARPSPDNRFHRCSYPRNLQWHSRGAGQGPEGWIEVGKTTTRCFWAPALVW